MTRTVADGTGACLICHRPRPFCAKPPIQYVPTSLTAHFIDIVTSVQIPLEPASNAEAHERPNHKRC